MFAALANCTTDLFELAERHAMVLVFRSILSDVFGRKCTEISSIYRFLAYKSLLF